MTNDDNVYMGLTLVNVKEARVNLPKTITWTKKFKERVARLGKGLHWKLEMTLGVENFHQTRFASKIIMFKKTLEFKQVIVLCYGMHKTLSLH